MWCTGTEQNRTDRSTPCSEPLPFLLRKCTQRTAAGQTHLLSKGSFPAVFILEGIFLSCAFAQCFYNIFLRIAYKSVFFFIPSSQEKRDLIHPHLCIHTCNQCLGGILPMVQEHRKKKTTITYPSICCPKGFSALSSS